MEAGPQPSGGADVLFDVEVNGATPDAIPVEPAAVTFDAPGNGYGSLFGDSPQPGPSPNSGPRRVPEQPVGRAGQPEDRAAPFPPTQADAPIVRGPMRQPAEAQSLAYQVEVPGPRDPLQRRAGERESDQLHDANMRTVSLSHTSAGQPIFDEPVPSPVARRPGSRSESEALSELAQSVGSTRDSGPVGGDTSLSDLAAATGLRRNTAPRETPTSAQPQPRSSPPPTGWEQSNEYPVLFPEGDSSHRSRMRWPVVVVLLLAVVATAGYFLGFQKWIISGKTASPQPSATQASNPVKRDPDPTAAAVTPHDPAIKPPETTPAGKPPENPPPVVKPEPPPVASTPGNVDVAQARYSLQAASFPKEAQAREFSDKLVRAGVPAYIMSIDIPRRGRWFRVRVGQFPSADEAGKYAPQARQRARAAGISLDLIVCDFEKS